MTFESSFLSYQNLTKMKNPILLLVLSLIGLQVWAQSGPEINADGIIFPKLATPPATLESTVGQIIYNTSLARFQTFDGSAWVDLVSSDIPTKIRNEDNDTEVVANENGANGDRVDIRVEGLSGTNFVRRANSIILGFPGGDGNIFIGGNAGSNINTGQDNSFLGHNAGHNTQGGGANSFYGRAAGYLNESGSDNTYIGRSAGFKSVSGESNTMIGRRAGYNNTDNYSTMVGAYAGTSSNGQQNTFLGYRSGHSMDGNYNTSIGTNAGDDDGSGSRNVLIGYSAGKSAGGSNFNVFVGSEAGQNASAGSANLYLGYSAGLNNTGGNNVFIGHEAGRDEVGQSNKLIIGNGTGASQNEALIYGDFSNDYVGVGGVLQIDGRSIKMPDNSSNMDEVLKRGTGNVDVEIGDINDNNGDLRFYSGGSQGMILENSGRVGIGTNTPASALDVNGDIRASTVFCNGTPLCSDIRFKERFNTIEKPLEKVLALNGISHFWKDDKEFEDWGFDTDKKQLGFIAQEVLEVVPEVVYELENGYYSVEYNKLTALLVEAMKEQQEMIGLLQKQLSASKSQHTYLARRLAQLEHSTGGSSDE